MSNTKKFNSAIKVGDFTTDPSDTEVGTIYFNSVTNQLKFRNNSSYNAVLGMLSDDTAPVLGGDLITNGFSIKSLTDLLLQATGSIRRAKSASPSDFVEEEYIHNSPLMANQTGVVITGLSFNFSMFEGCIIEYKLKDSAGSVRVGTMHIATNGTGVNLTDNSSDVGVIDIDFDTMIVGAAASLVMQDLTYTAVVPNSSGNSITVEYVNDGTAGSETVSVLAQAITVHIQSGVSTANQIITAVQASLPASALVTVFLSGLNVAQVTDGPDTLTGGTDVSVAVTYTSGTETAVLRADLKRIKA